MWLPRNPISNQLFYDDRLIVSDLLPEPIVWDITKVETIHPYGINKFTLAQGKFNRETDYINYETGEMYADYYKYPINVEPNDFRLEFIGTDEIKVGGKSRLIKVKYLSENFNIDELEWDFLVNDQNINNFIKLAKTDNETASILFVGDESYVGDILTIRAAHKGHFSEIKVNISAL